MFLIIEDVVFFLLGRNICMYYDTHCDATILLQFMKFRGLLSSFNESVTLREGFTKASKGSTKPSRSVSSRRLREACKAPPRTLRGGSMY